MSTIVTRNGKGSPLTFNEADANFTNLNNDKYQANDSPTFNVITGTTYVGLPEASSVLDGIVPASGGGTTNFLRADMTWAPPGTSPWTTGRTNDFASFGGNGGSMGGWGGPNQSVGGLGSYTNCSGQENPTAGTSSPWLMLPASQFGQNSIWGVTWGANWSPFTKNLQPFNLAVTVRPRVIGDATTNNWAFGFGNSTSLPQGGSGTPETTYTNFFGFRYPNSGDGTTFRVVNRVASVPSVTDTAITIPTVEEIVRLGVFVANDVATFTIEEMQSDLSFTEVYSQDIALSAMSDVNFFPVLGGPVAVGNIINIITIRGQFTL